MKFLYTVSVALAGTLLAAAEWIPVNIGQFHVTPGKSVTIDFTVSGEKAETVAGTLRNYSGSPAGTVTLHRCGENLYRLTHAFARGFHELEIPGAQQKFGIIALPEYSGIPDRFFGMEPLLCREKIERIRTTLDFLKRNGIVSFREYHGWHQEEPEKGRWRLYHGEAIYEEASRRDISGFFFFDRTPQWARPEGRYPTDLIGTGDSIAAMVRRRQAGLNALQIWNEPDLKRLPADQYLSLQAVASYILRAGGIDLPLVGAGFSSWQTGGETLQQYFDGKMPAFIDVFAFHSYHKPEEMLRLITTYRSYLKKAGKGGMPIWITESGKPWKRGNANPQRTYGGPHGKLRAEADEDRVSARWITLKAVEAKAGGVAGYFPFTLRSFREGPNNFGMMDFQWTPHRSLAAYFFCAQILANRDYIGDLNRLPRGIWSARVFAGADGQAVAVLDAAGKSIDISGRELPKGTMFAADGTELRPNAVGKYKVEDYCYLRFPRRAAAGKLQQDTPHMALWRLAADYQATPRNASPIVYQFAHKAIRNKGATGYLANPTKLKVTAFNLSGEAREISPELELPAGVHLLRAPEKRTLSPRSSAVLEWEVDASSNRDFPLTLLLTDSRNQSAPLPLVFLRFDRTRIAELDFSNPKRWKANSSGTMEITADSEKKTLHFHCDFSKTRGSFWTYPEYIFNPDESRKNLIGVSFEIKAVQVPAATHFQAANVMAVFNMGNRYKSIIMEKPTSGKWEKREILFPAEWNLEEMKKFRIGMNPVSQQLDFWIRNLKFHYTK